MYVAVKGGERAIDNAHTWLAEERRGDRSVAELSVDQIREQMTLAVNRVMAEGSLYDPDLAALAIKQARGDLIEAVFLIRAYRTTLPRFGYSQPLDTGDMACERRISATFKDLPGGQVLLFDGLGSVWRELPVTRVPDCTACGETALVRPPIGAAQVVLTPGRSLAVDTTLFPLHLPVWLETSLPALTENANGLALNRLMVTQDTGGAIKGANRFDTFWGAGEEARAIAGGMSARGSALVLIPKASAARLGL